MIWQSFKDLIELFFHLKYFNIEISFFTRIFPCILVLFYPNIKILYRSLYLSLETSHLIFHFLSWILKIFDSIMRCFFALLQIFHLLLDDISLNFLVFLDQLHLLPQILLNNVEGVNLFVISFDPFFDCSYWMALVLYLKVHVSEDLFLLSYHS